MQGAFYRNALVIQYGGVGGSKVGTINIIICYPCPKVLTAVGIIQLSYLADEILLLPVYGGHSGF
jgi:hypothetical protein